MRVKGEGVDAVARAVAKCDDIVFEFMFCHRLHASNVARLQGRKVALHHGHIDGCKKPRSSYFAFKLSKLDHAPTPSQSGLTGACALGVSSQ